MKFILHIGPGKTGSSAIQFMLLKYSKKLQEYGIVLMPDYALDGSHHELAYLIEQAGKGSADDIKKLSAVVALAKKLAVDNNAKIIISSSDMFANLNPSGISIFNKILLQSDMQLTVVMFLRNLYQIAISTLQQQIKNGKQIKSIYLHKPYTYFSTTKRFLDVIGHDNLLVINYDNIIDRKHSIFCYFLNTILAKDLESNLFEDIKVNTSIGRIQLQIFNYLNGYFRYPIQQDELPLINGFRWAIMNCHDTTKVTISEEESGMLGEFFLYDQELFSNFLPDFSYIAESGIYELPKEIIDISFNETVCKKPDIDMLNNLFGFMGG